MNMKSPPNWRWFIAVVFLNVVGETLSEEKNLSCYQCIKNKNVECSKEELLPCPSSSDRCVTHISKDAEKGFQIKRECGLGPCTFKDAMANKGLGWDTCDRSKDEYFCLFCCRESGCNKNSANLSTSRPVFLLVILLLILVMVVKNFQPPYVPNSD